MHFPSNSAVFFSRIADKIADLRFFCAFSARPRRITIMHLKRPFWPLKRQKYIFPLWFSTPKKLSMSEMCTVYFGTDRITQKMPMLRMRKTLLSKNPNFDFFGVLWRFLRNTKILQIPMVFDRRWRRVDFDAFCEKITFFSFCFFLFCGEKYTFPNNAPLTLFEHFFSFDTVCYFALTYFFCTGEARAHNDVFFAQKNSHGNLFCSLELIIYPSKKQTGG